MKVAFVDNTCNNGYVVIRYLNDRGIDADLILLGTGGGHADPANDTFDKEYYHKIIQTNWSEKGFLRLSKKELKRVFDQYDFVIGSDFTPAFFYRINRKLDVFQPHGTDIFNYPFAKIKSISKKSIGEWLLGIWQRKGIANNINHFMFEMTNDENEKYVKYFPVNSFKRIYKTIPLVYYPQYTEQTIDKFSSQSEKVLLLKKLRAENYTILFHHCQQQWENPYHLLFYKGNDKLIRGLKKYIETHPSTKVKLVMIERGTDIETSKKLIQDLGLEEYVIWFPFMPRKEIMACLAYANLGIGELGHSWFTYSVVSEFMVMGVPVIHHCDMDYYKTVHESVYPMYNANSSEEIYDLLKRYFENPAPFVQTGLEAQRWWRKNMADDAIDLIVQLIEDKK